ncbi:MAG TPA: hypothetical protein VFP30_07285 [Candidatus Limnocylindria bacterium]|nr:hypothetical protein [Candidatus Limnocylindria bacterium]
MRRLLPLVLASLVFVALAGPASAQTPIDERRVREAIPLGSADTVITPEEGCAFPVSVEDIAGKITYVFITEDRHGNVLERTIFHTIARYTNLDTGASFERRFDSVGNFLTRPDGTLRVIGRNDTLIWGPEPAAAGLTPGIWLIDMGRMVFEYDAAGGVVSAELQFGETIDVCAMLD